MSRKELTPAQRDIFYHLKILNPFGDRFTNITVKDIAEVLELSKRTVSDALKVLYQLGWIDLELISADFRVCPRASKFDTSAVKFRSMEKLPQDQEKFSQTEYLEPLSGIGSGSPHTNKTIKTNKISLSDKEKKRERNF